MQRPGPDVQRGQQPGPAQCNQPGQPNRPRQDTGQCNGKRVHKKQGKEEPDRS